MVDILRCSHSGVRSEERQVRSEKWGAGGAIAQKQKIFRFFAHISLHACPTKSFQEIKVAQFCMPFTLSFTSKSYLKAFPRYDRSKSGTLSELHRYRIATIETSNFRYMFWVGNVIGVPKKHYEPFCECTLKSRIFYPKGPPCGSNRKLSKKNFRSKFDLNMIGSFP